MKQITPSLVLALLCVMLSSCGDSSKERALMAQWKQENGRLARELGERVFEKDDYLIFSAIMLAWTQAGLEVKNCGRAAGFIIAEGRAPLSDDEAMPLHRRRTDDISRVGGKNAKSTTAPDHYCATTTIAQLGKSRTKVSLRLTCTSRRGTGEWTRQEDGYPPIIEAIYKKLWQRLDRQIFVQEHLIHRRYLLGTDPNM